MLNVGQQSSLRDSTHQGRLETCFGFCFNLNTAASFWLLIIMANKMPGVKYEKFLLFELKNTWINVPDNENWDNRN